MGGKGSNHGSKVNKGIMPSMPPRGIPAKQIETMQSIVFRQADKKDENTKSSNPSDDIGKKADKLDKKDLAAIGELHPPTADVIADITKEGEELLAEGSTAEPSIKAQQKLESTANKLKDQIDELAGQSGMPGKQEKIDNAVNGAIAQSFKEVGKVVQKEAPTEKQKDWYSHIATAAYNSLKDLWKNFGPTPANSGQRTILADFLFSLWGRQINGILDGVGMGKAKDFWKGMEPIKPEPEEEERERKHKERKEQLQKEAREVIERLHPKYNPPKNDIDNFVLNNLIEATVIRRRKFEERARKNEDATKIEDPVVNTLELLALDGLKESGAEIYYPEADIAANPRERIYAIFEKIGIRDAIYDKYNIRELQNELERLQGGSEEDKDIESIGILTEALDEAMKRADQEIDRLVLGVKRDKPSQTKHPETLALVHAMNNGYHLLVQDFLTGLSQERESLKKDYSPEEQQEIVDKARKDINNKKVPPNKALEAAKKEFEQQKEQRKKEQAEAEKKTKEEKEKTEKEAIAAQEKARQEAQQNLINEAKQTSAAMAQAHHDTVAKMELGVATPANLVSLTEQNAQQLDAIIKEIDKNGDEATKSALQQIVGSLKGAERVGNLSFIQKVLAPVVGKQGWSDQSGNKNVAQQAKVLAARHDFMTKISETFDKISNKLNTMNEGEGITARTLRVLKVFLDGQVKAGNFALITSTGEKDSTFVDTIVGATALNLFNSGIRKEPSLKSKYPRTVASKAEFDRTKAEFEATVISKATTFLQQLGISPAQTKKIIKANADMLLQGWL